MSELFSNSDTQDAAILVIFQYIEGTFGSLVMYLCFIVGLLISSFRIWKIGARKRAVIGVLLLLSVVISVWCIGFFWVSNVPWSVSVSLILVIIAMFTFPLYSAVILYLKGDRVAAKIIGSLWFVAAALFVARSLVSDSCGGPYESCSTSKEPCIVEPTNLLK